MVRQMQEDPAPWQGGKVLFVHTGGLLGMFDKSQQLQPLLEAQGRTHRLEIS